MIRLIVGRLIGAAAANLNFVRVFVSEPDADGGSVDLGSNSLAIPIGAFDLLVIFWSSEPLHFTSDCDELTMSRQ